MNPWCLHGAQHRDHQALQISCKNHRVSIVRGASANLLSNAKVGRSSRAGVFPAQNRIRSDAESVCPGFPWHVGCRANQLFRVRSSRAFPAGKKCFCFSFCSRRQKQTEGKDREAQRYVSREGVSLDLRYSGSRRQTVLCSDDRNETFQNGCEEDGSYFRTSCRSSEPPIASRGYTRFWVGRKFRDALLDESLDQAIRSEHPSIWRR